MEKEKQRLGINGNLNNYTLFVCGFMFDVDRKQVALIKKNRPDWQKGFLNGIGGKIELFETPLDAMVREFKEETGYETNKDIWNLLANIDQNDEFHVTFFHSVGDLSKLKTVESEEIVILPLKDLFESNALPSAKWLINLCLDKTHQFTSSLYNKIE